MKTAKIILLNGTGSSGKTSLARALQAASRDVFLHVQMDAFLDMLPTGALRRSGRFHLRVVDRRREQCRIDT